ncbi:MAG: chromate resistance protein [Deltaproteobacteria bacterium]|nr:chromate resistance protein [Deltaproteobacteria bacterium]
MKKTEPYRWIILAHHIPPKPGYLRTKISKRLAALGAIGLKNALYVLPDSEDTRESFSWLVKEIEDGGGRAFLSAGIFFLGITGEQVKALFIAARNTEYEQLVQSARAYLEQLSSTAKRPETLRNDAFEYVNELRKRYDEIRGKDFFGAPGRDSAEGVLSAIERRLHQQSKNISDALQQGPKNIEDYRGKTWVTRKRIHIDRIASAWLVLRYFDDQARFKFVSSKDYKPKNDEVRFDMFQAEFTHEGDRCTFEVILGRLSLDDPALTAIAEVIHDLDMKDAKYGRPEAHGVLALLSGITLRYEADEERISRGMQLLDDLYRYFQTTRH